MSGRAVETSRGSFDPEEELVVSGVTIPEDDRVLTPAIRAAMLAGRFEDDEARHIPNVVRAGDSVLEIGAGIGFISTLLDREAVRRIVAVEANPHLLDYMAELHARNGVSKVRRVNAVLTNGPEASATFYLRRDFWMGSLSAEPNAYLGTVEVPTMNLDALIREEAINLIVCDVEGAEADLFDGADLSGVDRNARPRDRSLRGAPAVSDHAGARVRLRSAAFLRQRGAVPAAGSSRHRAALCRLRRAAVSLLDAGHQLGGRLRAVAEPDSKGVCPSAAKAVETAGRTATLPSAAITAASAATEAMPASEAANTALRVRIGPVV
jgi:FkbM family methyltransferase